MKRIAAVLGAVCVLVSPQAAHAQSTSTKAAKAELAAIERDVTHIVTKVQPDTEIDTGNDIFLCEYKTDNYSIQPHDSQGNRLPAYLELGPLKGGFYLQISLVDYQPDARTSTVPATKTIPWTTVTSFYPFSNKSLMAMMIWEAKPGLKSLIPARVSKILTEYAAKVK